MTMRALDHETLPLPDYYDIPWDGEKARKRLRRLVVRLEAECYPREAAMDVYASAFLVIDGDPLNYTSYKFPIAEPMRNDEIKVVPRAIWAAKAYAHGARSGKPLRGEVRRRVDATLKRYTALIRSHFGRVPNPLTEPSGKAMSERTDPGLWREVVHEVSQSRLDSTDGKRNWDAYAAGQATKLYESRGGAYHTSKKPREGIQEWFDEEWVSLHPDTGEIIGPCGTREFSRGGKTHRLKRNDPPLRCLARERAEGMTPAQRRKTARSKARARLGQNVENVDVRKRNPMDLYDEFHESINMTPEELRSWAAGDKRHFASTATGQNSLDRIVQLVRKPRSKWTDRDLKFARKAINFNNRHLEQVVRAHHERGGSGGFGREVNRSGWSKRHIALRNWGHTPDKPDSPAYEADLEWTDDCGGDVDARRERD